MTVFYPSELCRSLNFGFSVTPHGDPRSMQPTRGRRFVRGGSRADPATVTGAEQLVLAWQIARFRRFWEEEALFGSVPFFLPDQQHDGKTLLMPDLEVITTSGDAEIEFTGWWECIFIGRPSEPRPYRGRWLINFDLEVL